MAINAANIPEEVIVALEYAVKTATQHGAIIAGFVIRDDEKQPGMIGMMNFGNDRNLIDNADFYKEACDVTREKIRGGLTMTHKVGEVA